MDITKLYTVEAHGRGAEMQLRDDEGNKLELFITMVGIDSKQWKKAYLDSRKAVLDDVEIDADSIALSNAALSWRGFKNPDGTELPFSCKSLEELFTNAPYIKSQADLFMSRRGNFTQG